MSKFTDGLKRFFTRNDSNDNLPLGSNLNVWGTQSFFNQPLVGKYSDIYFWSLVNKIFNGLNNSRFVNNGNTLFVDDVKNFLNREVRHIIWNYWKDGIVVVDITDEYFIVDDYKKNAKGEVIVPNRAEYIVYYADTYLLKRISRFQIIRNELMLIDKFASALDFLTSTYGSVCLISGKEFPMNTRDKEDLNRQFKTNLGITADKQQFIVGGKDLNMHQFNFDMSGLDLQGKLDKQYLMLADFFGIPKNILTTDTDSTYENQNAALKRFYTDCLSPLCEVVLEVGRMIIRNSYELVSSDDLSFKFDNVDCLNDTEKFISDIKGLLEIAGNENISQSAKAQITDIINRKIEEYQ